MTKRGDSKPNIQAVTFSPHTIRRHREQLCEWVKANGLDPSTIPDRHPIQVEEGKDGPVIRYRAFVLTDDGKKQLEPIHSDEVLTEERTAPCSVPPPSLASATAQPEAEASE